MATVNELYQQYLLTQPGASGSQNTYQQLLAKMQPFVNPYPESKGLVSGTTTTTTPIKVNVMGTYSGGGSGSGSSSGGGMTTPFDSMTNAEKAAFYAANPTLASITQLGQKGFGLTSLGQLQNYFNPGFVSEQGLIAMGVDPQAYQAAKESFRASEYSPQAQANVDTAITNMSSPTAISMTNMQNALYDDTAAINAMNAMNALTAAGVPNATAQEMAADYFSSMQDAGLIGSYGYNPSDDAGITGGGMPSQGYDSGYSASDDAGVTGGGMPSQGDDSGYSASDDAGVTGGGSPSQGSDSGGYDSGGYDSGGYGGDGGDGGGYGGDGGGYGGDSGYAKGGKVTKNRLRGPDPKGPDQGHGLLQVGEFVIKKSAVKKYGEGLLGMINDGKIPVQKMKSLLG